MLPDLRQNQPSIVRKKHDERAGFEKAAALIYLVRSSCEVFLERKVMVEVLGGQGLTSFKASALGPFHSTGKRATARWKPSIGVVLKFREALGP